MDTFMQLHGAARGGGAKAESARKIIGRCERDPLFFCTKVLGGEQPWEKQAEILRSVRDASRVAVRSGHGVGKTWAAARACLWFLYTHPHSVVLTTAPTQRQVRSILWAELRRQWRASRMPLGGRLTETRLVLDDDWFALGLSTDEPERFQGYHAAHLFLVMDEAPGVPATLYDAAQSLLTSHHVRILLIGNPVASHGPFYDAFRSPFWRTLHIPATACPNITEGRVVYPKLVTQQWITEQRTLWGPRSAAFKTRVMGEFPAETDDRLIPLEWLEASGKRPETSGDVAERLGVDVARYGGDRTAFALAGEHGLLDLRTTENRSTMETAGQVIEYIRRYKLFPPHVLVDDAGVGGGVVDRLREQAQDVDAYLAAGRASNERFANRRAESYWRLRMRLAPDSERPFRIQPDLGALRRELTEVRYTFNSMGQILIEPKEAIRARLGHSPDLADAVAMAAGCPPPPPDPRFFWFDDMGGVQIL